MAHSPRTGPIAVYAAPRSSTSASVHRCMGASGEAAGKTPKRFFPRFASTPPRRRLGTRSPLVYSPPPEALWSEPHESFPLTLPRRSRLELAVHPELTPAWRQIRAELRRVVGESTYEIWLAPLEVKAWDGDVLVVQAPAATRAWVAKRFGRILDTCAKSVAGAGIRVVFAGLDGDTATAHGSRRHTQVDLPGAFNPRYSFQQFIIGDGNRLAHAASLAVAELPGQAYNPLFLHAPPGLGKTHLLHAIGNYILAFGGGATVRYTTVEAFTNHFIASLGSRSLDRFKSAYRDADVLLIDDVQFLASKVKTEEEFFHTFNSLYETGRQLVLTCD